MFLSSTTDYHGLAWAAELSIAGLHIPVGYIVIFTSIGKYVLFWVLIAGFWLNACQTIKRVSFYLISEHYVEKLVVFLN